MLVCNAPDLDRHGLSDSPVAVLIPFPLLRKLTISSRPQSVDGRPRDRFAAGCIKTPLPDFQHGANDGQGHGYLSGPSRYRLRA